MQSTSWKRTFVYEKRPAPNAHEPPIIEGRSLIDAAAESSAHECPALGRMPSDGRIEFPAFYREDIMAVTFRSADALRSREEREEYACLWFERMRRKRSLVLVLIPHHIYASKEHVFFHTGWTLSERDGEIRTRQRVVMLAGDAVPIGRADQGVLCVARCDELSAWSGQTQEQSRAQAA